MSKQLIGILDYGAGNCTSVRLAITRVGFRTRLVKYYEDFSGLQALLIPGVGAFPSAMKALNELQLIEPIREYAHQNRPLIGICLGMQLLADVSYEHEYTRGLGLIPGEVKPLGKPLWHTGWNTLEVVHKEGISDGSDAASFYFNHAFEFNTRENYIVATANIGRPVAAMVRKNNICGFQFHPEKSQIAGMQLMKRAINELSHA
ncbi:MAG: imidazole glycerol phosphate synthase subunit HisH [Legionella sp.]|nr:imidazole glycerol phosphate synthase subunit HisH [Legionella sp.]